MHCWAPWQTLSCVPRAWPGGGRVQERSIILAGLRRALSMAAAKAYSTCLLDRVSRVGEEHRQAARRRAWVKREEERMQEERRAFWHSNVRARGLNRGTLITT
jgi:hypothetical protein